MIAIILISSGMGWLSGIWFNWMIIFSVLALLAYAAFDGAFDGGLEKIPGIIATVCFCRTMIIIGFISGDASVAQIGNFLSLAFTGE